MLCLSLFLLLSLSWCQSIVEFDIEGPSMHFGYSANGLNITYIRVPNPCTIYEIYNKTEDTIYAIVPYVPGNADILYIAGCGYLNMAKNAIESGAHALVIKSFVSPPGLDAFRWYIGENRSLDVYTIIITSDVYDSLLYLIEYNDVVFGNMTNTENRWAWLFQKPFGMWIGFQCVEIFLALVTLIWAASKLHLFIKKQGVQIKEINLAQLVLFIQILSNAIRIAAAVDFLGVLELIPYPYARFLATITVPIDLIATILLVLYWYEVSVGLAGPTKIVFISQNLSKYIALFFSVALIVGDIVANCLMDTDIGEWVFVISIGLSLIVCIVIVASFLVMGCRVRSKLIELTNQMGPSFNSVNLNKGGENLRAPLMTANQLSLSRRQNFKRRVEIFSISLTSSAAFLILFVIGIPVTYFLATTPLGLWFSMALLTFSWQFLSMMYVRVFHAPRDFPSTSSVSAKNSNVHS